MDYHIFKSALNRYLARYIGKDKRPTYFDINATFPALNIITQNFSTIKEEFMQVYSTNKNFPRYHDIDPGEKTISDTTAKNWNVFMLYLLGHKPAQTRSLCPQTCHFLDKIPNLVQAFFSILDPGKSIPLHEGPYLGYLRYHLGLHIPIHDPPRIFVNNQPYFWREGEAILFDDSWPHAVENHSQDYRAVLIIDVLRPLPFLPSLINKFVTNIIAKYTYGRSVIKRVKQYAIIDKPLIQ